MPEKDQFSHMPPFQRKLGEQLLAAAQRDLAERAQMESFGIDPDNPTPEQLEEWQTTRPPADERPTDYSQDIQAYGSGA